jgi:sulfur carrier protein ThiS
MLKWLWSPNPAVGAEELDLEEMDNSLTREVAAILARAGVPTFHKTLPRLRAEVDRARRYRRPLTLALIGDARLRGAAWRTRRTEPLGPGSPLIPVLIAPVLTEMTRSIDIVTYASTLAQCVVVLPEAAGPQAADALRRMSELCTARVQVPVQARLATFPDHGVTLEELLRKASATVHTAAVAVDGAAIPVRQTLGV